MTYYINFTELIINFKTVPNFACFFCLSKRHVDNAHFYSQSSIFLNV